MNSTTVWTTDDMPLVAFLAIQDVEPENEGWEQSRSSRNRSYFWHFADSTDLADLVADYYGGRGRVDPRQFHEVMGRLKRDIHAQQRRDRNSQGR